jgi:hypothetical protein
VQRLGLVLLLEGCFASRSPHNSQLFYILTTADSVCVDSFRSAVVSGSSSSAVVSIKRTRKPAAAAACDAAPAATQAHTRTNISPFNPSHQNQYFTAKHIHRDK